MKYRILYDQGTLIYYVQSCNNNTYAWKSINDNTTEANNNRKEFLTIENARRHIASKMNDKPKPQINNADSPYDILISEF